MILNERVRRRSMNLSLISGGVGVFWFVVCLPQQFMALYVRNALGASPSIWGLVAGVMQAAGIINLASIPLYARATNRKMTWITLTGLQRVSAFAVAAGAFSVAAGAPRVNAITITLIAGVAYTLLGAIAGTGWWAWMADLVPVKNRSGFFGRRSAIVQAVNVVSLFSLSFALDRVNGEPAIFIFYGILYSMAGILGTVDILLHLPIPDPGDPAKGRPRPGDLSVPWRDRRFRQFALAIGVCVVGINMTGPFVAPYVTGRDGLNAPYLWIGITASISQGAWVLTAAFWGRVMDRVGKLPVLVIGSLFPLAWSAYLFANPSNYVFVLPGLSLGAGLLASAFFDGMPQAVNALSEKGSRTSYMAWYWTVFAAAGAAGPVLGGLLIETAAHFGYNGFRFAVIATVVLTVVGAFLMMRVRLPEAPVRQTLPAIVSPSVLRNYGWTGIIERPDRPERIGLALRSLDGRSARMAHPVVLERLDDPDPDVREEAVRSLGRFGGSGDIPILSSRLLNPLSTVRVTAARALGTIGHPDGSPALLKGLNDASEEVRESCAAALGRTGSADAVAALTNLLTGDDTERVKVAGAMALSRNGITDAFEAIFLLRRRSGSPLLRRQLAVALADLLGPPGGFYRYLPGTADTAGGAGSDRLFRRTGRHLAHLASRGRRRGVEVLNEEMTGAVYPLAHERFESGDYNGAAEQLVGLVENLLENWFRNFTLSPAGPVSPIPGRLLMNLVKQDLQEGAVLEQEDVLLIVWYLAAYTGESL